MDASTPNASVARLELLSAPGCRSCDRVHRRLQASLDARPKLPVKLERIDILDDLDRAVELGVLRTPALILDGRLVAQGAEIDVDKVCAALREER